MRRRGRRRSRRARGMRWEGEGKWMGRKEGDKEEEEE